MKTPRAPGCAAFFFAFMLALPAAAQTPPIVDTHVHVDGRVRPGNGTDWPAAARRAVERMDAAGVRLSLALPPPQPPGFPGTWECDEYAAALRSFAGRFGLICGGGTINRLIYENAGRAELDSRTAQRIDEMVNRFAASGAVAIGEITAQHFSFEPRHPYMGMSPDHPVLLKLMDAAAGHRLPVVLHMEAVSGGFDMPEGLRRASPLNPARIADNMAAFERLLAHNREAIVVWTHFGWDNTGQRSGELMKALFDRHPNLYADIKIQLGSPPARGITAPDGGLRPDFVAAIEASADRYMIGSDAFYTLQATPAAREMERLTGAVKILVGALSPDAGRKVGFENAALVYRLKERGLVP